MSKPKRLTSVQICWHCCQFSTAALPEKQKEAIRFNVYLTWTYACVCVRVYYVTNWVVVTYSLSDYLLKPRFVALFPSTSLPSHDICFDFFCCCSAPSTIHSLFFSEPPLFGCLPVWQLQSTVDTHLSKRTELGHAWGRGVARGGKRGGEGPEWKVLQHVHNSSNAFNGPSDIVSDSNGNWGNLSVKCQTTTRNLLRVASACCQRLCL